MSVEVTPLGNACNLSCTYCYQNPMRDGGNLGASYDLDAMKRALVAQGQAFTVFGGEALLTPIPVLEELWTLGLERFGYNNVQTNGALITDEHVALFKRYKVSVGFSLDGPEELNDSRWAGSVEKTRAATARSQAALQRVLAEGLPGSLIVTLHKLNASTPELRGRLKAWLRELAAKGLRYSRLHALEVDHPLVRAKLGMTNTQKIEAFLDFAAFERDLPRTDAGDPIIRFDVFRDIERSLAGSEDRTCHWNPCDPYTTSAVQGIDGHGNASNCGRTNKDGVTWAKAPRPGHERQLALYQTPQEDGGCQSCRFFLMCNGQCPGTAIDGDWRNRSEDCEVYKALFELKEREMLERGVLPLSLAPNRAALEREHLARLAAGPTSANAHGDEHGDHMDSAICNRDHGDHTDQARVVVEHGDSAHADHTDDAMLDRRMVIVPVIDGRATA